MNKLDAIARLRPTRRLWCLSFLALAATAGWRSVSAAPLPDLVPLEVARAELEAGRAIMIDVREPDEHAQGVAPGARLLPMRQLGARLSEIPTDPRTPVLLICNTQNRSKATWQALRERGYQNVHYVEGGMSQWLRRGWPRVPPPR